METSNILLQIIGFFCCAAIITYSGSKLAKYGDQIAELTGWGKAWVGLILMAAVTTLPELISGISSVAIVNAPDLAAGNVFGSCVFNLLILSIMDIQLKQPLSSLVKGGHLFAGLLGIILIAISGVALLTNQYVPDFLWFSPFSILLIIVYIIAVKAVYTFDKMNEELPISEMKPIDKKKLKKTFYHYAWNAIIVISAALFLPVFGENIALASGMGETFFGTLFLAASTSLPEMVVAITAVRIQAFDLAVGNIMGSNIFNLLILAIDDIFYTEGSIFRAINIDHMLSILFVIMMAAVAGLGLMAKSTRHVWKLGIDTFIIAVLYIIMLIILYVSR